MKFRSGIVLAGAAALLAACGSNFSINSSDGVPLSEFDYADATPTGISLAGPDRVVVTSGETLAIEVEGSAEATEGVRFEMDGDELEISREGRLMGSSVATVRVTMPTPSSLSLAGSGEIELDRLGSGGEASVSIAGSGEARVARIAAGTLEVSIAGSGDLVGAGSAETLDLSIAGSGDVDLRNVQVENADISIAGSGDAVFSSDGTVEASIMGSGDVTVLGSASCSVKSMGSGTVKCERSGAGASASEADTGTASTQDEQSAQ